MNELTNKELDNLSNKDLVSRMDTILNSIADEKRNGMSKRIRAISDVARLKVNDIYTTKLIQSSTAENQRNLVYKLFNFLIQIEYVETTLATANKQPNWSDTPLINSPRQRLNIEASEQWIIVSSVIAWETLLEFIYFLDKSKNLKRNPSKYKTIRLWLQEKNNFSYFSLISYKALIFDHKKRGREVHATSPSYRKILKLSRKEDYDEKNSNLELYNILLNLKQPLVDLCNNTRPNIIHGGDTFNWVNSYFSGSKEEYEKKVDEIVSSMQNLDGGAT